MKVIRSAKDHSCDLLFFMRAIFGGSTAGVRSTVVQMLSSYYFLRSNQRLEIEITKRQSNIRTGVKIRETVLQPLLSCAEDNRIITNCARAEHLQVQLVA